VPGRDLFRTLFSHAFLHASSALLDSILAPIWPPFWINIWPKIVKSQVLQAPSREQPKKLPLKVEYVAFEYEKYSKNDGGCSKSHFSHVRDEVGKKPLLPFILGAHLEQNRTKNLIKLASKSQ